MSRKRSRDDTIRALDRVLTDLSPEIRRIVLYHLGWADEHGVELARRGGKKYRGALCLDGTEAAGLDRDGALPAAVAIELLNNFSYLHDDIMDGDRERAHRTTAWVVFGVGPAILAGTALLNLGAQTLLGSGSPHATDATARYMGAAATMLGGQARDITLESPLDTTVEEVLDIIDRKTGASFGLGASLGCLLAGGSERATSALAEFGRVLGTAFQARNDILGVWGEPARTGGRPVGYDLRARRATLPVVAALAEGGEPAERLREILGQDELDDADVEACQMAIMSNGGLESTVEIARTGVARAEAALRGEEFSEEGRQQLMEIGSSALPEPALLAVARGERPPASG